MARKNARMRSAAIGPVALIVVSVCSVFSVPHHPTLAQAQDAVGAPTQRTLDPAVDGALRRMGAALARAPALTVHLTSLRETAMRPDSDQVITLGSTVAVGIRRPDHVAALVGGDRGSFRLWYDGTTVTLLNITANAYARAAMAGDIEVFLDALEDRLGVTVPLRDLLAPDPYAALTEAGTTGMQVGRTVVNGALCDHYALRNGEIDWQIWIAVGAQPLPCRLAVIDRAAPGAPRVLLEFQEWNLQPRLDTGVFDFAAPAGAQEVTWLERRRSPPSSEGR